MAGRICCASIDRGFIRPTRSVPRWRGLALSDATPTLAYPNPSPRATARSSSSRATEALPAAHVCVLLHWLDGRFINQRLTPAHLRRVGALAGQLQEHGASWAPPSGFLRPRVDTL